MTDDPTKISLAISAAITQHLREDADDGFHTYEIGEYYPHAIGMCPLRYYYIYKVAKSNPLSDESLNITSAGRVVHDLVQSALRRVGYRLEVPFELRVQDGVRIVGRVDAYWPGGKLSDNDPVARTMISILGTDDLPPHIIEIKSSRYRFPSEPYHKHKQQLNLYLRAFNLTHGFFIYVSRSNFSRKIFPFEYSPDLYNESLKWVLDLHNALVTDTPPEPHPVADWECKGCPLQDICPYSPTFTTLEDYMYQPHGLSES